jgi:CHAT domain-containing protein
MMRSHRTLLVAILFALLFLASRARAQNDEQNLTTFIKTFYATYESQDVVGNGALWSPQSPLQAGFKKQLNDLFAASNYAVIRCEVSHIRVEGDRADLRTNVELRATDRKTGQQQKVVLISNFQLVRYAATWSVMSLSSAVEDLSAALAAAGSDNERTSLLDAAPELIDLSLAQNLLMRGDRLQRSDQMGALLSYQASLMVATRLKSPLGIARALGNLGNVHSDQGQYVLALHEFEECMATFTRENYKLGIAISKGNLGIVHYRLGQYDVALEEQLESARLSDELHSKEGVARAYNNIGILYATQRNYDQALFNLEKARQLREGTPNRYGLALVYGNMGAAYAGQGQYDLAQQRYDAARQIFTDLGQGAQRELALTANNLGFLYVQRKQFEPAASELANSLRLAEKIKDVDTAARSRLLLANLHLLRKEYTEALELAEKARAFAAQASDGEMLWLAQYFRGTALKELHRPAEAFAALSEAVNQVENLRNQFSGNESSIQLYGEDKVDAYHAMMEFLLAEHKPDEALGYAERAKARVLLSILQHGRTDVYKEMTLEEQRKERELLATLTTCNVQFYREKQSGTVSQETLAQQQVARQEYEGFLKEVYARHPDLKIRRGQAQIITPADRQTLVRDEQTAVLLFVVAQNRTHLFVLTRAGGRANIKHYSIEITKEALAGQVQAYRDLVAGRLSGFSPSAQHLYSLLLGQARAQLANKTHLVISPDDTLWELPFQALEPTQHHYLIQDADIVYAPSLTARKEMLRRGPGVPAGASRLLLALGNPSLGAPTAVDNGSRLAGEAFEDLALFTKQVEDLGRIYGKERCLSLTGAEATEDRFKDLAGKYRVLHLAMHAYANNTSPLYSYLAFAVPKPGGHEDGILEAWEMLNMDLRADLAVLSACNSAEGRVGVGEGIVGLTWSLFVAGCRATITSQWLARDDSASALVREFYRAWLPVAPTAHPLNKARALQQAQIRLLGQKDFRHPFYWANFILIGDER